MARERFFAGLAVIGVLVAHLPTQAASPAEPLLRPTPLMLKDGRIANVSIYKVPFAHGNAELTPAADADLTELTRAVGTDCFLTAQVIGHIDSSEIAAQDSLSGHRLARSRADAVQASLIHGGLSANAIASVWDWQFMVQEARATLWIFQLMEGEDCEGRRPREDMVAQAPRSSVQPETPGQASQPALAPVELAPQPALRRTLETESRELAAEPASERDSAERRRDALQGGSIVSAAAAAERPPETQTEISWAPLELSPVALWNEMASVPTIVQPLPPVTSEAPPATMRAAVVTPDSMKAPRPAVELAEHNDGIETRPESHLGITFPTNSTYLTPDAASRLRQLLAEVGSGGHYEASLQVAVSGTTEVVGATSPREAARYNKWLAERRLKRVQEWLLRNAGLSAQSIKPEYQANDESRQIIVRLIPVS